MNPEIWEAKLVQRQKSIFQPVVTAPTSTPACSLSLWPEECVVCVRVGVAVRVCISGAFTARAGNGVPGGAKDAASFCTSAAEPAWAGLE